MITDHDSSFIWRLNLLTYLISIYKGEARECDDFEIAVLMNRTEYKKKKLRSIGSKTPFNICCIFCNNSVS
jgi:hypothetical protein